MNMNMNRLLSLVLVVAVWALTGQVHADTLLQSVDEALKEPTRLVAEWESDRTIAFSTVATVFVLGAVIAIIHTLPTTASKIAAVVLGSTVSLLTALSNAYFDFDHRQYKAMASQGRQLLTEINIKKIQLQEFPVEQKQAREAIFEEIRKYANAIVGLPSTFKERPVIGAPVATNTAGLADMLVSSAVAQQAIPQWVNRLPQDDSNLYFLGNADARDYFAALQASRQSAYDEARTYLAARLASGDRTHGVDNSSAARYLLDSARVASTYAYYDKSRNAFRSYTLLSLSKAVAESDLRLYGAKTSQQVSPVQQQILRNSVRTQDAYISNRKEVTRAQ
jgi:hypothetical protein